MSFLNSGGLNRWRIGGSFSSQEKELPAGRAVVWKEFRNYSAAFDTQERRRRVQSDRISHSTAFPALYVGLGPERRQRSTGDHAPRLSR
jgi:hypothetical protein